MNMLQGERVGGPPSSFNDGYVESQLRSSYEDYLKLASDPVSSGWEERYMGILRTSGDEAKAVDFLSVRFLSWCQDSIDGDNRKIVSIPSENNFFRQVNDNVRHHMGRFIADRNKQDECVVPQTDWSNPIQYLPYAVGSNQQEIIGTVLNPENSAQSIVVCCDYIFDSKLQDIYGVNYKFMPLV